MAHAMSDFIEGIKESLTDAQYKEGLELCQAFFMKKKSEKKLYTMTYLRPYTFLTDHCEDIDCMDNKFCIAFSKVTGNVFLTERQLQQIRDDHVFRGNLESFIDVDVLRSFPDDNESLGSELEWFEFPVISVEENVDTEHVQAPEPERADTEE